MFHPSAHIVGNYLRLQKINHTFADMENLLKYCRYYNGESECPFESGPERGYWLIESAWVQHFGLQTDSEANSIIRFCKSPFHNINIHDGIPISLAAAILDYFEKKNEGVYHEDEFLRYYENYKKRRA